VIVFTTFFDDRSHLFAELVVVLAVLTPGKLTP